jgi:hypothetical protein
MSGIVGSKLNIRGSGVVAKLGTDGQMLESAGAGKQADWADSAAYDDDAVQSNIAVLGFKVATNGSLAKYNLVDQTIDDYNDTSGVDAGASTNEVRTGSGANDGAPFYYYGATGANPTGGNAIDTSVSGYRIHVFTSDGSLVVTDSGDVGALVIAGGGGTGKPNSGGGGAGGLIYKATHGLTANTYDMVIGGGGVGCATNSCKGTVGGDSTWTINGGATEFTAKGGGGSGYEGQAGLDGGSGGADGYYPPANNYGNATQPSQPGDSGTYGFGFRGGSGPASPPLYRSGGGGGAGSVGSSPNGGSGKDMSTEYGTNYGEAGFFASGGSASGGTSPAGGGGNASTDGDANTGGGGGTGDVGTGTTGSGGSGIILVRYADDAFGDNADLTLQSVDATALTAPTYGELVCLMEDGAGTATLNTDIKGYVSRDSGSTFTQGTFANEGSWGTSRKIIAFHDLDISGQPSGTSMCYKITTHNQGGSKQTRVYATSIGWK